jgi:hypothetical protein
MSGFTGILPTGFNVDVKKSSKMVCTPYVSRAHASTLVSGSSPNEPLALATVEASISTTNSSGVIKVSLMKGNQPLYSAEAYGADAYTEIDPDTGLPVTYPSWMMASIAVQQDSDAPANGEYDASTHTFRISGAGSYIVKIEMSGDIDGATVNGQTVLSRRQSNGSSSWSDTGNTSFQCSGTGRAVFELPFTLVP